MANPFAQKDSNDHQNELVFIRKCDYVRIKVMTKINDGISELKLEKVWKKQDDDRYHESTIVVSYH